MSIIDMNKKYVGISISRNDIIANFKIRKEKNIKEIDDIITFMNEEQITDLVKNATEYLFDKFMDGMLDEIEVLYIE